MEERINQLESLAAMQDSTIAELSAELFRQQQDIARLQARLEQLESRMENIAPAEETAGNEKPPHW